MKNPPKRRTLKAQPDCQRKLWAAAMQEDRFTVSAYGVRVPKIIYGTAWKKERTADCVELALALGFRGIDTACQPKHYDEPGVGEGLARCLADGLARADVYLQSKFTPANGQDPKRMPYDPKAGLPEQVAQSFATSLRNLQTDYLDCLVLHSPLADEADLLAVWRAMEDIVANGGAKQLGISNCYALPQLERLYAQAAVKPAVLQNRFYADTGYDLAIRAFCHERQILYQSFWTLTANPQVLRSDIVSAMAEKHGQMPEQIFFRYLTQIGVIPLTGTRSELHMCEDLEIFGFALAADEILALDGLLTRGGLERPA
ncbi:MAG: aldo/keto reductase family protein [Candidatus Methylumidiphilus sp.]